MCELTALIGCRKPNPGLSIRGAIIAAHGVKKMPRTKKKMAAAPTGGGTYEYALGDGVRFGEAFTLMPDAHWIPMEFVVSSGELHAQLIGTEGFKSFQSELMGKYVGTNDQVRDFVEQLNDCCGGWIIAIPTLDDPDTAAIIGSIDAPCQFDMPKMTTAKKAGEESSTEVKFTDIGGKTWRSYPLTLGLPPITTV
jgi:hypothetical protein